MDLLTNIVLLLHILGVAAIVGSAVFVARGQATPALVWGARAQLLTGIILIGLAEASATSASPAPNHVWTTIKLLVALAVVACAEMASVKARKGEPHATLVNAAGALALLNVGVAVLWPQG